MFKDDTISYIYTAQRQGQKTLGDNILIVAEGFATSIMHCKFQPLVLNTFLRK